MNIERQVVRVTFILGLFQVETSIAKCETRCVRWKRGPGTYFRTTRRQPFGPINPLIMLELTSAISRGGIRNTVQMLGSKSPLMFRIVRPYS